MAGIYKRGDVYWGRVQRGGKEHRRSLKTGSPGIARKRLEEWLKELEAIGWGDRPRKTLNEVCDLFIQEHLPNIKHQSARRYGISIAWLDQRMGNRMLDEISSRDLVEFETWRRSNGAKAPTIRRDLACLSSIFSFGIEREWIDTNPVGPFLKRAKKRGLREGQARQRYLSRDEEARLIAAATPNVQQAIVLAIYTGLRQRELFTLQWGAVDLSAKTISVDSATAKSNRSRKVVILQPAIAVLKNMPRHIRSPYVLWHGRGEPYRHLNRGLAGAARRAKITDLNWHDLRRTHGCRLLQEQGWKMEMVRDQLGHHSVTVTEKSYAFLELETRLAAVPRNVPALPAAETGDE